MNFDNLIEITHKTIQIDSHTISVGKLLLFALIWLITIPLVRNMRKNYEMKKQSGERGKRYAYFHIIRNSTVIVVALISLRLLGFRASVLLASSTAVLVGIGLSLQDTLKDWFAGFVLLLERTVTAGDIIELNGIVGKVEEVKLRTTVIKTREDISLILPNQQLTTGIVTNWSQNSVTTRFRIQVGVAYGSDVSLVRDLLLEVAQEHHNVLNHPEPIVLFSDFGESSLDFTLFFLSNELFRIERVKSDLRYMIYKKFSKHNITLPFPQRDVWMRSTEET